MKKQVLMAPIVTVLALATPTLALAAQDYGSEGSNGDYTCINPNQPAGVPGCPNDQPQHSSQHHTSEYLQGYKTGQIDGRTGIYDPGSCCPAMNELQIQHWLQGYHDGYKSICGTTYSRQNPPCSSPPT